MQPVFWRILSLLNSFILNTYILVQLKGWNKKGKFRFCQRPKVETRKCRKEDHFQLEINYHPPQTKTEFVLLQFHWPASITEFTLVSNICLVHVLFHLFNMHICLDFWVLNGDAGLNAFAKTHLMFIARVFLSSATFFRSTKGVSERY